MLLDLFFTHSLYNYKLLSIRFAHYYIAIIILIITNKSNLFLSNHTFSNSFQFYLNTNIVFVYLYLNILKIV
jgi:hypothetical protein